MNIIDSVIKESIWVRAMRPGGVERRKKDPNKTQGINQRERERGREPSRGLDSPVDQAEKKRQRNGVNEVVESIIGKINDWHDMGSPDWHKKSPDDKKNQVNSEIDWGKVNHDFNFLAEWNDQIVNDVVKKLDDYHKMNTSM